jgi:8-oxo-dGTP diphosphatase
MNTRQQIKNILENNKFDSATEKEFQDLLKSDSFTRDSGSTHHFCVYFLPHNKEEQKVFLIHHKKSGLWLSPGGHIDDEENVLGALNREILEELGVDKFFNELPNSFYVSTVEIDRPKYPQCRKHYDIWFLVETDGNDFNVDPREFHSAKWMTIGEAKEIAEDPSTLEALSLIR